MRFPASTSGSSILLWMYVLDTSRSSCRGNVDPHFDLLSFSHQVFATRDITAGEELHFSYAGAGTTAERTKSLGTWKIMCRCPNCADAKVSDDRYRKILKDVNSIECQHLQVKPEDAKLEYWTNRAKTSLEQISLIELEGLEGSSLYLRNLIVLCAIWKAKMGERKFFVNVVAQEYLKKLRGAMRAHFKDVDEAETWKRLREWRFAGIRLGQ